MKRFFLRKVHLVETAKKKNEMVGNFVSKTHWYCLPVDVPVKVHCFHIPSGPRNSNIIRGCSILEHFQKWECKNSPSLETNGELQFKMMVILKNLVGGVGIMTIIFLKNPVFQLNRPNLATSQELS